MARKVFGVYFLIGGIAGVLVALISGAGEQATQDMEFAVVLLAIGALLIAPKSTQGMARKVWGTIFLLGGLGGLSFLAQWGEGATTNNEIALGGVLAVIGLVLLSNIGNKEAKQRKEEARIQKRIQQRAQAEMLRQRRLKVLRGDHMTGLPLPQGADCSLCFDEGRLTISGGGQEFRLSYDKVVSIELHTDVDIQKSYVSSVGGAVGGYMLFGELGAMVGGRAKERTSTVEEYYALVTYLKEGTSAGLSFRTMDGALAQEIIDEHRGKWCRTSFRMKPVEL